jgi:hypothetical protein
LRSQRTAAPTLGSVIRSCLISSIGFADDLTEPFFSSSFLTSYGFS